MRTLAVLASVMIALVMTVLATHEAQADPNPAKRAAAFVDFMGVQLHVRFKSTPYYTDFENVKASLTELGIKHIRDKAQLYDSAGDPRDAELYSLYREIYAATGARFMLEFEPDIGTLDHVSADEVGLIEDMMRTDSGTALESFAGWNEPNTDQPEGWQQAATDYQCEVYDAVHDPANSGFKLAAPGLNRIEFPQNDDGTPDYSQIPQMHECVDVALTKGYTHGWPSTLKRYKTGEYSLERDLTMARHIGGTGKPVVMAEMGYYTLPNSFEGVAESVAAKYVLRSWTEHFKLGVQRSYVYQLRDARDDPPPLDDRQAHFGLLRYDGTEKPSFRATENLIDILQDPGPKFTPGKLAYTLSGANPSTHTILLQDRPSRGGAFYLLAWQEVLSWDNQNNIELSPPPDSVTLNLPNGARKVEVFLPGRIAAAGPADNAETHPSRTLTTNVRKVSLRIPDEVMVVKIKPR